ncbi:MAG: XRE family transcriptional regulator [Caulobacteraceae bacterium]
MAEQTLGGILRRFREERGWTLREMSARSGIAFSTLSKIEHDRLSLAFDKLQEVSRKLNISMSALLAEGQDVSRGNGAGRKSVGGISSALRINTAHYDYFYLHTDLRQKQMVPDAITIRAKSLDEFGELLRHDGEEFSFVLKGQVIVHTAFYEPIILNEGESIYLDSGMGHAYIAGPDCDEATMIGVMYNPHENAMNSLIELVEERAKAVSR